MREPYQEESQIAGGPEHEPTFAFARLTDPDWCQIGIMLYYNNITETCWPSDDPSSSSSSSG
jgi:hypothetical protein